MSRMPFSFPSAALISALLIASAVVFFLVGSVGLFQFVAANQAWPQELAEMVIEMNLTPLPFLFSYLCLLLILGMFLDGIAMILLTVPVIFPVAQALDIDPVHLGIVVTMGVELSVITPPVGFNLYAVSGIAQIPIKTVLGGAIIRPYNNHHNCPGA